MNRKSLVLALALAGAVIAPVGADRHPKAAQIQAYIDMNPIESKIPEMTKRITAESLALNTQGYEAYEQKRYETALQKFKQAISADDGNSLAYYNAACVMALTYASLPVGDRLPSMEMVILRYLRQAIERHWYWGLWMMADSDLDSVRRFSWEGGVDGLTLSLSKDPEDGNVDTILHDDGTVTNVTESPGGAIRLEGYFCIIGGYVLQHIPEAILRARSHAARNLNLLTRIDRFGSRRSPK